MSKRVPWDCDQDGHSWIEVPTGAMVPTTLMCRACGLSGDLDGSVPFRPADQQCVGVGHPWLIDMGDDGMPTGLTCPRCRARRYVKT